MMTVTRLEGVHHSPVSNIYVYMHIYMRIYTQIHTYIHTDRHTHTHARTHAHTHTHTHTGGVSFDSISFVYGATQATH